MQVSQKIEIKIRGENGTAFVAIIMGSKRSAQKRYESLDEARRASDEMVAKHCGVEVNWLPFNPDTSMQIGSYQFEVAK